MRTEEALAAYALQLEGDGRSPHTVRQARRHVRLLILAVGDIEVADVRHEDVARFLASDTVVKRADGRVRRPSSANALRSSLRGFLGFAHAAGYTATNAGRLIRRARCPTPRPRGLSEADVERLVTALVKATSSAEKRDRVLIHVMLRCGLRIGSALGLDVADVDLEAGDLRLRHMKFGGEDVVPMPVETAVLLRDHLAGRANGPVFQAANGERLGQRQAARRIEQWGKRAGLDAPVSAHRLRHSFAMRIYRATGDVMVTARALCHRSVASTAIYARPDAARVRAAVGI